MFIKKGKAIPVTGHGGSHHFLDNRLSDGCEVVSLTRLLAAIEPVTFRLVAQCLNQLRYT
jgi:hypothetical protein